MSEVGKLVMVVGCLLIILGFLLWKLPWLFGWLGKLPGDISIQKGHFSFYFPVVTCILISIILSLIGWFLRR